MKTFRKFLVLPTWLMVNVMTPLLPTEHKWKNRHFSLSDWAKNATNITFCISMLFWNSFIFFIVFLILVNK